MPRMNILNAVEQEAFESTPPHCQNALQRSLAIVLDVKRRRAIICTIVGLESERRAPGSSAICFLFIHCPPMQRS